MSERHLAKGDALPPVDPECMRLYRMRFCPFAHRTKLVLDHKKIPYESVFVHLKNKPDWLFERNPNGTVPVLEHKGNVIYESGICSEFLEDAYPGSSNGTHPLMPSCPFERAAMRLLMQKVDKIPPVAFGILKANDVEKKTENFNTLQSRLDELEGHLAATAEPFFGGSQYGLPDLHLYPVFERFPALSKLHADILPLKRYPRLNAWISGMQELDIVKKMWISPKMHYQYMVDNQAGAPQYEVEMDEETIAMQKSVA